MALEEVSAVDDGAVFAFPTGFPGSRENVGADLAAEVRPVEVDIRAHRATDRVGGWDGVGTDEVVGVRTYTTWTRGPSYAVVFVFFFSFLFFVLIGISVGYVDLGG